jgi:hypothetical protein
VAHKDEQTVHRGRASAAPGQGRDHTNRFWTRTRLGSLGASAGEPRPPTQRTDDDAGIWVLCSVNTDTEILPCCLLPRGTAELGRYVREQ